MILLLNRSFYPDTEATGQFLTDLAVRLARCFPVTAVCGRPLTGVDGMRGWVRRERHAGVRILRVRHSRFPKHFAMGRLINWFTYAGLAFLAALGERPRYLFVQTDPPLLSAVALVLARLLRCRIVMNCRDLYPDVALALGAVEPGLLSRLLDAVNRRAFRESVATVVLGDDMARRIEAKGVPRDRILVIPDWVDTTALVPEPCPRERFTIMYSGNVGLTQDFDVILEACAQLGVDRSCWGLTFVGGGAARGRIEERIHKLGLENTTLLPPQPRGRLSALLSSGTLHVVPMKPGLAGCVVPSKIYGIMAAGRPYLAICDSDCDMARLVRDERCGLWAPAGDVEAVCEQLEWAMMHPEELDVMGRHARELAVERFDSQRIMDRWVAFFEELTRAKYMRHKNGGTPCAE